MRRRAAVPMLLFVCACAYQAPIGAELSAPVEHTLPAEPLPGVLFLINGRALAAGHTPAEVERLRVTSVHHLIGPAAQPYLRPRFREVYLITAGDTVGARLITLP